MGQTLVLAGTWDSMNTPHPSAPRVLGFYSAGCIAGAMALPQKGPGFQVMRPSRNRYYGHPNLIQFVKKLGRYADSRGARLLIGDLSQPRGGPMAYGHRSHQIGLDADIWFRLSKDGRPLSRRDSEQLAMRSVVKASAGRLDNTRWSHRFRDILKVAAESPQVERIFVNPVIKQALCRSETDRAWLRKLRPWWGHDAHFHVRLGCPAGNHECQPQKAPPPGDGCNGSLADWVKELQQAALSPSFNRKKSKPKPVVLPQRCTALLQDG